MNANTAPVALDGIARDNEGFLLDPEDWTADLAAALAAEAGQPLTDDHWEIVHFIRDYFEATETVPEARRVLAFMRERWGEERATRRALYALFPTGYGQTACKIAGMRKPLKLMLDV